MGYPFLSSRAGYLWMDGRDTMRTASTTGYKFGTVGYDLHDRTYVMGILNVTPDSFSDGGHFFDPEIAVRHGLAMVGQGADFIDIGGESTRPGAESISVEEELNRVIPVIERIHKLVPVPISIDTYKSAVADQALAAGAVIVNDISGLHADPELARVVARHSASLVLMHMRGTPKSMQQSPAYDDVVEEICRYLREGIMKAQAQGVGQIIVDPGIGFGKTLSHNLEIIRNLKEFQRLGYPVMIGPSRKSFIGSVLDVEVEDRLEGTAAAVAASIMNGASIVRVHDVRAIKRVSRMMDAIVRDGR